MPDARISALPTATVPLAGTEVLPIVQSGTTDKVTAADLLRQNGQTVTTSNPVLSLAQTWNAGGVTFTGMLFNATSTASASQSLLLDLQVGGTSQFKVNKSGAGTFTEGVSAGTYLRVNGTNSGYLAFGTADDVVLQRDGASNTLALRNGVNAQTLRIYKTFTDGANYERGVAQWDSTVFEVGTEAAGTGTIRGTRVKTAGAATLYFQTSSLDRWAFDTSGNFAAVADNIYDIGASGANRPRSLYVGTDVTASNSIRITGAAATNRLYHLYTGALLRWTFGANNTAESGTNAGSNFSLLSYDDSGTFLGTPLTIVRSTGASSFAGNLVFGTDNTYDIGASGATRPRYIYSANNVVTGGSFIGSSAGTLTYGARTTITSPADGVLLLQNNALADFTRLQFGGTTSAFPALKRNAANLEVKLADDSAFTDLTASVLKSAAATHAYVATAIPAGGTAGAGFRVSSTSNFGVFFGSGAPTLSAAKGSLYLRSDGSGTGDRMYVNTDGSTTWTAVTTAA